MAAQQKFHSEKTSYSKKEVVLKKELVKKGNCSEEIAALKKQLLHESSYFKDACSF